MMMVQISKEEFFALLSADPRDIMPTAHRDKSVWKVVRTGAVWGETTPGWMCRGPKTFAVEPSACKECGDPK